MRIEGVPFETMEWSRLPEQRADGEKGQVSSRVWETGNLRVRIVEYSPGYLADHWCARGHVVHVLSGVLVSELEDGRTFTLRAGDTYRVGQDMERHRSRTDAGAKLLIVD